MEAQYFKFLRSAKKRSKKTWEEAASWVNKRYGHLGVSVSGDQLREWAKRGIIPWGGFIGEAMGQFFDLPPTDAGDWLSNKKAEEEDDE